MTLLILGLILWTAAHFFKRLSPNARQSLTDRLGDGSKGVVALVLLLSVVLMVIGYRAAPFVSVYEPPSFLRHVNNLMMLFAVALMGLGSSKSRFNGTLRHPMLTGAIVWGVAHLFANGDLASIVLFGGITVWAYTQMVLINRAVPDWTPPEPGTAQGDIKLGVITLVLFAIIAGIHTWLGYFPFGS
ncbi:MAG: hypothetical protein GKR98_08725 [Boseongicola sp.]|nr:MAG: hypothetical protein GKR98_08725 [Boseongicola sp.]